MDLKNPFFRPTSSHCYRAGFTAIETVLAICILTVMGLLISRTVMQIVRASTRTSQSEKAATLAGMVLEQYKAYAALDFAHLASYDQEQATPQDFFHTRDNLGYDSLRITTLTENRPEGGASVKVVISWGRGSPSDSLIFTQTFGESARCAPAGAVSGT